MCFSSLVFLLLILHFTISLCYANWHSIFEILIAIFINTTNITTTTNNNDDLSNSIISIRATNKTKQIMT